MVHLLRANAFKLLSVQNNMNVAMNVYTHCTEVFSSTSHLVQPIITLNIYTNPKQLYPYTQYDKFLQHLHCAKKPVTTVKYMLIYPWKCTVLHCNHLGNTWKPLVLMTQHFDYCPSASEGDNQSVRSSAPVVSRCFLGGYNVKLYISRGRLAWWLLAFLCCESN